MCDGRLWCGGRLKFISATDPTPSWAGHQFTTGEILRPTAGVFLIGRQDGARVYAVYTGEASDIARAVTVLTRAVGPLLANATRIYWHRQDDPVLRENIVRTIVERYDPPLNLSESTAMALDGSPLAWQGSLATIH